jgi:hypothetical protein
VGKNRVEVLFRKLPAQRVRNPQGGQGSRSRLTRIYNISLERGQDEKIEEDVMILEYAENCLAP